MSGDIARDMGVVSSFSSEGDDIADFGLCMIGAAAYGVA